MLLTLIKGELQNDKFKKYFKTPYYVINILTVCNLIERCYPNGNSWTKIIPNFIQEETEKIFILLTTWKKLRSSNQEPPLPPPAQGQ